MNPNLIDRLKRRLIDLVPSLEFGAYLGDGAFSQVCAAKIRNVPCAIKFSKRP